MNCFITKNEQGAEHNMGDCIKKCKVCPFAFLVFTVIVFSVGYFLDAQVVRILWLIFASLGIIMGVGCLIMTKLLSKRS